MARFLSRLSTRVWLQAAIMTVLTTATGLVIFFGAFHLRIEALVDHMPAVERAGLAQGPGIHDLPMLLLVIAVSTVIGGGVSALLVRRITDPITAVAQAAARVADGEQGVRVDRGSAAGEPADLIEHFNKMASAIDTYERERSVLTAGVAHELRTPLTILKGRLHGLKDGVIDPAGDEPDRLLRQVDHLLRIVGDMGTLALADAGRLTLAMQPVDLADVVGAAASDMKPLISSLGIALDETYQVAQVHGDPVRLTQIVTNLLSNAIKHAPNGSTISLRVEPRDGCAVASVADEGPGFTRSEGPRLFIPFWRSGSNAAEGRPGSGLGLALCAMMTEAHGGRIVAENRSDRSGARFTVSIPLLPAPR
ncbi:HAMP domain-containing sensor histidine kinase [Sphingobium sp. H39-3-25]|uniref:sensor histidine kinase n=1 Tax=Sphingobium arseniciresistens TaxID=3030834 RepID=UPI0023B8EE53|nr:HAMP domain-containing sensor histidine kinase [Sphingobium arseniciresistens]